MTGNATRVRDQGREPRKFGLLILIAGLVLLVVALASCTTWGAWENAQVQAAATVLAQASATADAQATLHPRATVQAKATEAAEARKAIATATAQADATRLAQSVAERSYLFQMYDILIGFAESLGYIATVMQADVITDDVWQEIKDELDVIDDLIDQTHYVSPPDTYADLHHQALDGLHACQRAMDTVRVLGEIEMTFGDEGLAEAMFVEFEPELNEQMQRCEDDVSPLMDRLSQLQYNQ